MMPPDITESTTAGNGNESLGVVSIAEGNRVADLTAVIGERSSKAHPGGGSAFFVAMNEADAEFHGSEGSREIYRSYCPCGHVSSLGRRNSPTREVVFA